jgi:mono/diheme cytochrome c family protein
VRPYALACLAVLAAGCGAGARHSSGVERGQAIFVHSCAGCHTLAGHESGAVGGDLLQLHLGAADLASFAQVMPTRPRLSPSGAAAVARYIESVAASKGKSP